MFLYAFVFLLVEVLCEMKAWQSRFRFKHLTCRHLSEPHIGICPREVPSQRQRNDSAALDTRSSNRDGSAYNSSSSIGHYQYRRD
jgi:hypothetical protein